MKLFVFSDIHANIDLMKKVAGAVKKNRAEAVLFAGDASIIGQGTNKIMNELNKLDVPVFLVHGNHDDENEMQKMCKGNLNFVHAKIVDWHDYAIFGWGGGGFSFIDKEFEKFVKQHRKELLGKKIILITHAPPYKTKLDKIGTYYTGNKSISDFIRKFNVILAVSGHIHENAGKKDKLENALIINAGPFGVVAEV